MLREIGGEEAQRQVAQVCRGTGEVFECVRKKYRFFFNGLNCLVAAPSRALSSFELAPVTQLSTDSAVD